MVWAESRAESRGQIIGGVTVDIQLACPWCDEDLRVARADLDGETRCDGCGIRFAFAADEPAALAVAA